MLLETPYSYYRLMLLFCIIALSDIEIGVSGLDNITRLLPTNFEQDAAFGTSISISDHFSVIGCPGETSVNGPDSGSAYVFSRFSTSLSWSLQTKLVPSFRQSSSKFGQTVSLHNTTIAVGTTASSNVFIFDFSVSLLSWSQSTILTSSSSDAYSYFGSSVDVNKNNLLVGSFFDNTIGAAYIYERYLLNNNYVWSEKCKLIASNSNPTIISYFGSSVSLYNEVAAVGAFATGFVYIYVSVNVWGSALWSEKQILTPKEGGMYSFGYTVDVVQNYFIVGAIYNDDVRNNAGASYIFKRRFQTGSWSQDARIYANPVSSAATNGNFGYAAAIYNYAGDAGDQGSPSPPRAVVTAKGQQQGYVFLRDDSLGWSYVQTLALSPTTSSFGVSAALSSSSIFVGDSQYLSSGAVYSYDIDTMMISDTHAPSSAPSQQPSQSSLSGAPSFSSLPPQPSSSPSSVPQTPTSSPSTTRHKSSSYDNSNLALFGLKINKFFFSILFVTTILFCFSLFYNDLIKPCLFKKDHADVVVAVAVAVEVDSFHSEEHDATDESSGDVEDGTHSDGQVEDSSHVEYNEEASNTSACTNDYDNDDNDSDSEGSDSCNTLQIDEPALSSLTMSRDQTVVLYDRGPLEHEDDIQYEL